MYIVKNRIFFYILSLFLVLGSVFAVFYYGLKYSIEFTGGTLLDGKYSVSRPDISVLYDKISAINIGNVSIQPVGERGLIIRAKTLDEKEHQAVSKSLTETAGAGNIFTEKRFDSIGP